MNRPLRTLILAVLIVIPSLFLPNPVRATSSWQCDNTGRSCNLDNDYSPTNCILNTNGNNESGVNGIGFGLALSTRGQFCDGTGFLSAYALAESSVSTDANAYAWIGFTDTITIPNYGQTTTHLNLGAFYALFGYVYTAGLGTLISSSASLAAMFSLTGPGVNTGNLIQNGGQPWASNCFSNTLGQLQFWPPPVGYCYDTRSQTVNLSGNQTQFSLSNIQVQAGGSYSLIFMVQANATAHSNVFSDVYGGSCFNIDYKVERNHDGTFNLGCHPGSGNQESPQTSCPVTMSSPCYYVKWYDTSYSIALTYSGTPDFSVSVGSSSRSSLLDDYYGATAPVQVQSINGFAGYVNLYYGMSPFQSVTPPNAYLKDSSGNLITNGTSFWVSPTSPLSLTFSVDPCSKPSTQTYCSNGYCASNPLSSSCGSNYQTTPPATPGPYLFQIEGISGSLTRETTLNLPILFYDFVVRNVASSYSGGILTVTATAGNMGNISPVGYGFSGVWGEAISYYLDGTLQSTINLCGQGSPGYFLHQDCPPGNMFTYAWQSSTTSATHNTTVTATEIIGVQQNLAALDGSNYGCVGSNCAQNSCYYASSCSVTITTNNQNDIIVAFVSDCSSNSQYPNCACLEPQFTSCVFTGLSDSSGLSWNNELYQQCGCGANAGTIYYATASSPVKNDVITLTTSSSSYILSLQVYAFSNTLERFDPNTQNPVSFLCGLQGYPSCSSFSESVPSNYAYDVAFASVYEQECVSYPCTLGGTISALSCCTLMMQDSNRASAAEFRLTSSTGWNPIGFSANLKQSDGELDLMADAIEAKTAICCTTLGDYFDINLNNNKLDSDFRLVPQSTMSTVYVSPGSSITTMITVAGFPDFSGTVSISGSAPSGWGLSFNTTSVSLNPSQHLNVTATISVPSSASLGNHTLTITGTSMIGGLSVTHSINVVAQVVPVILSNNPSSSDWSILKGTWTEKNGVIDATTSSSTTDPIMQSTGTFASNRTVTVRAITITAGSNVYNTAWIGGKYVDSSNSIILILHTDGKLELQFKQNGVQSSYTTGSTGLSPLVWHTFQMVFSGNTVNAYVDGTLYLTVTNSLVGSLGTAHISLESHGAPESQFDSATIT